MERDGAERTSDAERRLARRFVGARYLRSVPALLLAGVLLAYLVQGQRIGLRFPVPWPDEGSFLWQALAFRDHFSLFAPEVNPEREALWMPPGFMVLEGLVFEVVPFSLTAARALSALFIAGAVTSVFACVRRVETKFVFPALAALCIFCPIGSMAGNVARMEGLELAMLGLGFLLMHRRRPAALAVLLMAPLVHPNGIFGIAVGVPGYFILSRGKFGAVRRADWLVLAAATVAWGLYGFHVSQHWPDFLRDMDAQLRFKQYVSGADGGMVGRVTQPVVWGSALALVVAVIAAFRVEGGVGATAVFAGALLLQTVMAAGWLYEIYPAFAVLVTSVVAADAAFARLGASNAPLRSRVPRASLAATAIVGLTALAFRHNAFLERSLERATVVRKSLRPDYVTKPDQAALRAYLTSIVPPSGARRVAVQFLPDAEALLYEDLRGPTFGYVQQTFYEHSYDVLVVHDSVWFPPFVHNLELIKLLWAKGGTFDTTVVYERDGTERWTAYRWH